ncbi:MAG: hypothetical protein J6L81_08130 [Clostridia bacterium]|nr:hypothetical protein [Clostridia bacterium]
MDDLSGMIKKAIISKYGTIKDFCRVTGIPQSTLSSGLKRGVGNMSFNTVIQALFHLEIAPVGDAFMTVDDETRRLAEALSKLDDQGIQKIISVIES